MPSATPMGWLFIALVFGFTFCLVRLAPAARQTLLGWLTCTMHLLVTPCHEPTCDEVDRIAPSTPQQGTVDEVANAC